MSEVERYTSQDIATTTRWAEKYAGSGMFTDAKQVEQAFVKISAGAEMGLNPFESMTGIHIIQGKPVVGAGLLASLLDRASGYDYEVAWEGGDPATACTITVFKNGKERGKSRFSMDDAKRAGLGGGNYQKYPPNMLYARAMSNAVRWYAPSLTNGPTYVEDEITPTSRVEATVQRFNDPVSYPAEPVDPSEVEVDQPDDLPYEPVTMPRIAKGKLGDALKALNPYQRQTLFTEVGIAMVDGKVDPPVTMAVTRGLLAAKWDELGLPDYEDGEPVPVTLLGAIYASRREQADPQAAEDFDHFARTGQDLSVDPQTALT